MEKGSRLLNALFILVLMAILTAAYYEQYFKGEKPCPLCLLQRFAMLGIGLGLFLNLRCGLSSMHYGFSLLFALFGASVSLRQISLHVCPAFPVFGLPVFGLNLYTWAFLVFTSSAFAIGVLLFLQPKEQKMLRLSHFEWFSALVLLILAVLNCYTTFVECSFGLCKD